MEEFSAKPDFWQAQGQDSAKKISQKLSALKEEESVFSSLDREIKEIEEIADAFSKDKSLSLELEAKIADLEKRLKKEELKTFLSGKYDDHNALLSIMAGAGGQDLSLIHI